MQLYNSPGSGLKLKIIQKRIPLHLQLAVSMQEMNVKQLSQYVEKEIGRNPVLETNWDEYGSRWEGQTSRGKFYEGNRLIEPSDMGRKTFEMHLCGQLKDNGFNQEARRVAELIIANLDSDGYLRLPAEKLAGRACCEMGYAEDIRREIMQLDPPGAGARNLQECLLVQVQELPGDNSLVEQIVSGCLNDLAQKKHDVMAEKLNVEIDEIKKACLVVTELEPCPARAFDGDENPYVIPDFYVYRDGKDYEVSLHESNMPGLKINSFYQRMLAKRAVCSEKDLIIIERKIQAAAWLIHCIQQRRINMIKVMKSIIAFQRNFFDHGPDHLKFLMQKQVADDIAMHESNVSRIIKNKYVQTPYGLYELKKLFKRPALSKNGNLIDADRIIKDMQKIIDTEISTNPYTDREVSVILKRYGHSVSQRTVTKYRHRLRIPKHLERKKQYA